MYTYRLNKSIIYDENGEKHNVYGINAVRLDGLISKSFHDLFFEKEKAENMIRMLNDNKLELVHLEDVIEDILAK